MMWVFIEYNFVHLDFLNLKFKWACQMRPVEAGPVANNWATEWKWVSKSHWRNLLLEAVVHYKEIIFAKVCKVVWVMPHSVWAILLFYRMISLVRKWEYESMGVCFVLSMFTWVPWYWGESPKNFFVVCWLHKSYSRSLSIAFFVKHVGETAELTSSIEQLKSHICDPPFLFTSLITIADPFWKLFRSLLPNLLNRRFLKPPRLSQTYRHLFDASSDPIRTLMMLTPSVIAWMALPIIKPPHPHANQHHHHYPSNKREYSILLTDFLPYSLLTLYHYFRVSLLNMLSHNCTQSLFFN